MRPPPCDDPTDAACSSDEGRKLEACNSKLAPAQATYDSVCTLAQGKYGCYPSCFCSGSDHKADREATEKELSDVLKSIDSTKTCELKCGSGSSAAGLRAGAVTTLLLAAFALLAGH